MSELQPTPSTGDLTDAGRAERPDESAAPPADVLAEWDARLQALWNPGLSVALQAAGELFAPDGDSVEGEPEPTLPEVEERLSAEFWRILTSQQQKMPSSAADRYFTVVAALWILLRTVRQAPAAPFVEEYLAVALRPVRRLRAGGMTPALCATLYDYQRGIWTPHLTKPQLYTIRVALAKTVAALPPDSMSAFWNGLQSSDPMLRQAMLLGLEFLRSAHAVPHLLRGLETSKDHAVRAAIVDCLEATADPRALSTLTRLRRETAQDDWTLSRHIARVIRVIEQQNRGQNHRTLLRPTETPPDEEKSLLRPASDLNPPDSESATLLRPSEDETA
jgi:hypothetical protein